MEWEELPKLWEGSGSGATICHTVEQTPHRLACLLLLNQTLYNFIAVGVAEEQVGRRSLKS
jgi:hypothetical protein